MSAVLVPNPENTARAQDKRISVVMTTTKENPDRRESTEASIITAEVRSTEQIVVDNLHALSITLLLIYLLLGGFR